MIVIRTQALVKRLSDRLAAKRAVLGTDAGQSTVELLSWAAISVVTIVAIGAAIQVVGIDVVARIRALLGL